MTDYMISVIIPVYNGKKFISKSIESLLRQSYKNFEVIVVDDNSDDFNDMVDIVVKKMHDAKIFRMPRKGNAAISRNFGVKKASGEIISFLDADDEYDPNKLMLLNKSVNENKDCDIFLNSLTIKSKNSSVEIMHKSDRISCTISEYCFFYGNLVQTSSISIKKNIADQIEFDEEYNRFQDYTYISRLNKIVGGEKVCFYEKNTPLSVWNVGEDYRKKAKNLGENSYLVNKFMDDYSRCIGKKASFGFLLRHGLDVRRTAGKISCGIFLLKMAATHPKLMCEKIFIKIKRIIWGV